MAKIQISDKEFYFRLECKLKQIPAINLLYIPGIYEILSEEYNNEILDDFDLDQELKKEGV